MADSDKLWFEIGVRDNVTAKLKDIILAAESVSDAMEGVLSTKHIYENAVKVEEAFDKISVSLRKIESARKLTKDVGEISNLDKMEANLKKMRASFEALSLSEEMMGTKGTAAFTALHEGLRLAIMQIGRYTGSIDAQSKAEEKHAIEEMRRTNELKAKYDELMRYRQQLTEAIRNAAPGTTVSGATRRASQSLDYRIGKVDDAIHNGLAMPSSATGADYERFVRELRDRIHELTAETERYNTALARNESISRSLSSRIDDTASAKRIADIKGQTAEYAALTSKLRDIEELKRRVDNERVQMQSGQLAGAPIYTQARVMEELASIQRRYNETLAGVQRLEKQDADAKRQKVQQTRELAQANQGLAAAFDKVTQKGGEANRILNQMESQIAATFSVYAVERFMKSVIQVGGEFEVQHIALQSILGDIQQANSMFEQMKELAVVSPFNFRQLASYSKQVAAFGIPYEEMYDTTKRLADMAAGLGVDMGRLILAYGQVRSAAVLRGQELRQFTEAGIPMVRALADEFTKLNGRAVSTAEVFELISKRAVPFEMVKKVMWDMTDEGGRFYDMQFTLSDTLAGKWSNLQDAWEIMLSEFAKGESASGKFLKAAVTGLTSLIETANELKPALAYIVVAFGTLKMMKWGRGLGNLGFNKLDDQIKQAQKLRAIELTRSKINGDIDEKRYRELMRMNSQKKNYYQVLAMEGRLDKYQIQKAVQQKLILKGQLKYLRQMQIITAEEEKQIRLGTLNVSVWNRMGNSIKKAAAGMWSLIGGWNGVALLALEAIGTAIASWLFNMEEVKKKNEDLQEGFRNTAKELGETIKEISGNTPANDEEYRRGIEALKEQLKIHSANYDAIMRNASAITTLSGQYDYLKDELQKTQEIQEKAAELAPDFANAARDSFEDAKESLREYFRDIKRGGEGRDLGTAYGSLKDASEWIKNLIPSIGDDPDSNALFRQLRDSLIQELGIGSREAMMIKIKLNELLSVTDGESAADLVMPEFDKMILKLSPALANKIKYSTKDLNDAEQKKVQELINDAIRTTGDKYGEYKSYLQKLLDDSNFTATIKLRFSQDAKANELQKTVFDGMGMLSPTQTNSVMSWLKSGDMYEAKNMAKKDIDAAYNKWKALDDSYKAGKKGLEPLVKTARQEYEDIVNLASQSIAYDYKGTDQKSNKEPKKTTSKKDVILEAAKTRLEEIKDFYSEYKKYREQYGKEKGLNMVEQIFGVDHEGGQRIVDNYKDVLKEILDSVPMDGSEARKKFALSIRKLLGEINLDDAKTDLQKRLKDMERFLQDEVSKWNLYKNLLDKTNNKDFAMQAFVDGVKWDDITRSMAQRLQEMMGATSIDGWFDMDDDQAEAFFGKGTEQLKLWQEIVKEIRNNWTSGLNEVAAATEKLMTIEEKIAKTERELAELRREYGDNDVRSLEKERELATQRADAFEQSEEYIRFYSSILSMTLDEAERVGLAIKKNLVDELAKGGINADKYLKSIKNIDQQLEKARSHSGKGRFFIEGGIEGQLQRQYDAAYDDFAAKALEVQEADKALLEAKKKGDEYQIHLAERRLKIAQMELGVAEQRALLSEKQLKALQNFSKDLDTAIGIIHGMQEAVNTWQDAAKAVEGEEMEVAAWFEDTLGALDGIGQGVQSTIQSALSGNISGMITGAVSVLANPLKAIGQNHDKRRQREIEKSEKEVKSLTTAYHNLESAIDRALGGIYTSGGYTEMLNNLRKQREELQKQMDLEYDKKGTDMDKIADYKQQLKEMDETIMNFALDMAKSLYEIDVKSWANELGDALFDAWKKGEDGAEAFRKKAREIITDLTRNIVVTKVIETAMKPIEKIIEGEMLRTEGKLDEGSIYAIANALAEIGETLPDTVYNVFDAIDKGLAGTGIGSIKDDSSSSSTSTSIKGITEETADILASYVNAIRADVSVNRVTLTEILVAVQSHAEIPVIAEAQLVQLEQIATNTARNAEAAVAIYNILHSNVMGNGKFNVK